MDNLHFVLADRLVPLIEEWRYAFTQHLENLRGNISLIHSKLANLTPPIWTVGELYIFSGLRDRQTMCSLQLGPRKPLSINFGRVMRLPMRLCVRK